MDVLLIKPYSLLSNVLPPLGLGYLSSALQNKGISTKLIHCYKDKTSIPDILKLIREEKIKIVGVTCCSNDHFWLENFAKELEAFPEVYLIAGGPHPTGLSSRLMRLIPRLNFIIRSEGELAFPFLAEALLQSNLSDAILSKIPNLVWKNSEDALIENPLELPADLDQLSWPDWKQLSPREYAKFAPHGGFSRSIPVAQLITTRGCPYSCRYCASSVMNGKIIRRRSAENIAQEAAYLIKEHGIREIHIEDDNFTFYKEHVLAFCEAIRKNGIKLNFGLPNGVRPDKLDEEMLRELKNTGFYFLSLGIESGSPRILKAMRKELELEKVKQAVALAHKFDFRVKGFFMLGYPAETKEDILKTIESSLSLGLDQAFFSVYIPLPGTQEFRELENEGKIDIAKCNWQDYYTGKFSHPPFVPAGLTALELTNFVSSAYRRFYLRPGILFKLLKEISRPSQIKHLFSRSRHLMGKA